MARALLVGCGCHGRELAAELLGRGWAVRGTSRSADGAARIEASGAEGVVADPDRVGSLIELLGDVTVLAWLLGDDSGPGPASLNEERLPSLLEKVVDTPVRGLVFDGGESPNDVGRRAVEDARIRWHLPAAIQAIPRGDVRWRAGTADAIEEVLTGG